MIVLIACILALVAIVGLIVYARIANATLTSKGITTLFLAFIVFGILTSLSVGAQLNSTQANKDNLESYESLLLYRDVVEESYDELLRWDFYGRVQTWNNRYADYLEHRNNKWISSFYGAHDYDNCDIVTFELRRG